MRLFATIKYVDTLNLVQSQRGLLERKDQNLCTEQVTEQELLLQPLKIYLERILNYLDVNKK